MKFLSKQATDVHWGKMEFKLSEASSSNSHWEMKQPQLLGSQTEPEGGH